MFKITRETTEAFAEALAAMRDYDSRSAESSSMCKPKPKPDWIKPGDRVDYHNIINGRITSPDMEVEAGPELLANTWVVWLRGKAGCVAVDACTPAIPKPAEPSFPAPAATLEAQLLRKTE